MMKTFALAIAIVLGAGVAMPALAEDDRNVTLDGRIGASNVRMVLRVRDHTRLNGGHYSYTRYNQDISLTGRVSGETVALREDGGAQFSLHFETADRSATHPLTFDNSTALVGIWSGNGKTLPVRLNLEGSSFVQAAGQYRQVTDAPDAGFENIVSRFIEGVRTGNRAEAADATSYPLRVNAAGSYFVRSKADFVRLWPQIFTPCVVTRIGRAVPHDMFVHEGEAMVANGTVWFNARGATSINVADCK